MPIVYTRKRLRPPPPPPPSPSPPQTPTSLDSTKAPCKKRRYTQLFIDAGQKDFIKHCSCGMLYAPGKDDTLHKRYHATHKTPRWSPRTTAKRVANFAGLDLFLISPDHKSCNTVKRIDHFVSDKLGTVLAFPSHGWLSIIAVGKGFVRAFCLVERVQRGRLLEPADGVAMAGKVEKAIMGVRKIWVDPQFRGKGIATRLVEEACLSLVYGMVIETRFVAFSAPTADGTKFANRFCCGRVLVYDTDTDVAPC